MKTCLGYVTGFFDKWSEHMGHVLGWTFSDANVYKGKYSIELKNEDIHILEYIRDSLAPGKNFYHRKNRNTTALEIHSPEIVKSLEKYNVLPRKSLTLELPNIPNKYFWHVFRGIFEGDGCLYVTKDGKNAQLTISSGSMDFLNALQRRIKCGKVYEYHYDNGSSQRTLKISKKSDIIKVCEKMYKNANFYLGRKKNKYEFFKRTNLEGK